MIEINTTVKDRLPLKYIKTVLTKSVKQLKLKQADLSVAFVGNQEIKKLNQQYRSKNEITDVLSFDLGSNQDHLDGEIIISYPQAKNQALHKKQTIKKELATLLVHGLLHLAGHDHAKEKDDLKMQEIADNLLNTIFEHHL